MTKEEFCDALKSAQGFVVVVVPADSTPDSSPNAARCESAIRRVIRAKRRATIRELRQLTHQSRIASRATWDNALRAMVDAAEVRIDISPRGKKTVKLCGGGRA